MGTKPANQFDRLRQRFVDRLQKVDADSVNARAEQRTTAASDDAEASDEQGWQQLTLGPTPWAEPDAEIESDEVLLVTALATYVMAQHITAHTAGKRQATMQRVLDRRASEIHALTKEAGLGGFEPSDLIIELIDPWPARDRETLLIDLQFTDPFFPYDIKVSVSALDEALRWIARHVGMGDGLIDALSKVRQQAEAAHTKGRRLRVATFGAGGLVLVAAGGFALAPVIGGALGTSAGLTGAAATSHGLALLGGGTLAAGGGGMAGGMFLVTGVGGVAGAAGGGGAAFLMEVGTKQARLELVRLQVTYKMTLLSQQMNSAKAAEVVKNLQVEIDEAEALLEEERTLNDQNSRRLNDLEKKVEAMRNASRWMEEEAAPDIPA